MGFRATTSGINLNRDYLQPRQPRGSGHGPIWWPTGVPTSTWTTTSPTAPTTPGSDLDGGRRPASRPSRRRLGLRASAEGPRPPPPTPATPTAPMSPSATARTRARAWSWAGIQLPRLSTGYFPLINRPSILIEMHAHKPFRDRVLANRDFMDALILETGRAGERTHRGRRDGRESRHGTWQGRRRSVSGGGDLEAGRRPRLGPLARLPLHD